MVRENGISNVNRDVEFAAWPRIVTAAMTVWVNHGSSSPKTVAAQQQQSGETAPTTTQQMQQYRAGQVAKQPRRQTEWEPVSGSFRTHLTVSKFPMLVRVFPNSRN